MPAKSASYTTIDQYIRQFPPEIQRILQSIRETIRAAAPQAQEIISYRMPAFRKNGILLYFAAFKKHIGVFPPVKGDAALLKAIRPYAGPKGNLQFPLDKPMPYGLIKRLAKLRAKQDAAKAAAQRNP